MPAPPAASSWPPSRLARILAAVLVWAAAVWMFSEALWLSRGFPIGPDAGYYLTRTDQVAEGAVPYSDVRTMYPPGVYYVQQVYNRLFGRGPTGVANLLVVHHLLVLVLAGIVARRLNRSGPFALGLAATLYFWALPLYESFQYALEPLSGIWGWAGLAVAVAAVTGERADTHRRSVPVGAGLLTGLSAAIKQTGLAFVLAAALVLGFGGRRDLRSAAGVLAAALAWPAIFFLRHPGALADFWEQSVLLLYSYTGGRFAPVAESKSQLLGIVLQHRWITLSLPVAFLVALVLWWKSRPGDVRTHRIHAFLLGAGTLLVVPSLSRGYLHYYLYPLPFAILALLYLWRRLDRAVGPVAAAAVALAAVWFLVSPVEDLREYNLRARADGTNGFARQSELTDWIRSQAGPRERVLIVPDSPQYYYLAGYRSPLGRYEFFPALETLQAAREQDLPVFVIDRGHPRMGELHEELTRQGFRPVNGLDAGARLWRLAPGGSP